MLTPGQQIELSIEKPAAGGRMIGRHEGQIVFVLGTIPGERVRVRIDRVERQLAFATTITVLEPSPDRREPFVDPLCGGCLYAHVSYPAQLRIKAAVVCDAFSRLGRIEPPPVEVLPSPEAGYRMRGRLHVHGARAGFYREGTHEICDAAATKQLSAEAIRSAVSAAKILAGSGAHLVSVQVTENLAGDQRALHVELQPGTDLDAAALNEVVASEGLTGCSALGSAPVRLAGEPRVADPVNVLTGGRAARGTLRRAAASFFQANRFLLPGLVEGVLDAVAPDGPVLDLYAGVGLFSIALASTGRSEITAVEGDRTSGMDLRANASQFPGAVAVAVDSVEQYLAARRPGAETIIVDPPRTGISKGAMQAVASLGASRVVYVSCDPPTMARDARRLLDAGYRLASLRAFDLFPNTPHVESLGVFVRG